MKAEATRTCTIPDSIPGHKARLADIERLSKVTTSKIEGGTVLKDGRILLQRKEAGSDIARLVLVDGIDGGGQRVIVDPEDWRKRTGKPHAINYRSEEHTSELQSLMRISYAVFCLKKKQ